MELEDMERLFSMEDVMSVIGRKCLACMDNNDFVNGIYNDVYTNRKRAYFLCSKLPENDSHRHILRYNFNLTKQDVRVVEDEIDNIEDRLSYDKVRYKHALQSKLDELGIYSKFADRLFYHEFGFTSPDGEYKRAIITRDNLDIKDDILLLNRVRKG